MSAGGVAAARFANQQTGGGAIPTPALHNLQVRPVPMAIAKELLVREHYLHSMPGGTRLAFGVFLGHRFLGAMTIGVGPYNVHRLVERTQPEDCATLTRFWLSSELPKNSESRVLGVVLRALKQHTRLKFLVSYADPVHGHIGGIYQATGWVYTGLSEQMPLYDLGDGKVRHSRSLSHAYGTHSVEHFSKHGVEIRLVPQAAKHRYLYFLDTEAKDRLRADALPYPKREGIS